MDLVSGAAKIWKISEHGSWSCGPKRIREKDLFLSTNLKALLHLVLSVFSFSADQSSARSLAHRFLSSKKSLKSLAFLLLWLSGLRLESGIIFKEWCGSHWAGKGTGLCYTMWTPGSSWTWVTGSEHWKRWFLLHGIHHGVGQEDTGHSLEHFSAMRRSSPILLTRKEGMVRKQAHHHQNQGKYVLKTAGGLRLSEGRGRRG